MHAVAKTDDNVLIPICTWNQTESTAVARTRAGQCSALIVGAQPLEDWLVDVVEQLCGNCRQRTPTSFMVQAMGAGLEVKD